MTQNSAVKGTDVISRKREVWMPMASGVAAPFQHVAKLSGAWMRKRLDENAPKGGIAVLDGVRACAAITVMAYHINLIGRNIHLWNPATTNPLLSAVVLSGSSGVTLFFVLSGFLLFLPYARALLADQSWPSARRFYLRRALRILPAYYFSLVVLVLIAKPEYLDPHRWTELGIFVFFLQDATPQTFRQLNGPYWTLAIEWQFYMLLPWLCLGLRFLIRHVRVEWRLWAISAGLCGLMAWGMATRAWGDYYIQHPSASTQLPRGLFDTFFFFFYGRDGKFLEDFAVGMLVGLLFTFLSVPALAARAAQVMRRLSPVFLGGGVAILLLMAARNYTASVGYVWPVAQNFLSQWEWCTEAGFAVGYGCCIVAIVYGAPRLQGIFSWHPLRWIGITSFSLYIWHLPLLYFFQYHLAPSLLGVAPPLVTYLLMWLWALAIVLPFATALFFLVEKPGMRLNERLRQRRAAPPHVEGAVERPAREVG